MSETSTLTILDVLEFINRADGPCRRRRPAAGEAAVPQRDRQRAGQLRREDLMGTYASLQSVIKNNQP